MLDTHSQHLRRNSELERRCDEEIIHLADALRRAVRKRLLDGELKRLALDPVMSVDEVIRLLDEQHGASPRWVAVLIREELEQLREGRR